MKFISKSPPIRIYLDGDEALAIHKELTQFSDYFDNFLAEYHSDGSPSTHEWDHAYEFLNRLKRAINGETNAS